MKKSRLKKKAYRASVQWVQSTELFVDAEDLEEAQRQVADMLKHSSVIWNSDWLTTTVRIDSVEEQGFKAEVTD